MKYKKLTKRQRNATYRNALRVLKHNLKVESGDTGLCLILENLLYHRYKMVVYYRDVGKYLPEFQKRKPSKPSVWAWWTHTTRGNNARIKALEKCIKLTS